MGLLGLIEIVMIQIDLIVISIIPLIFYLITLQNTVYEVKVENRKITPQQVWLMLIPLYGLVWQFIVVNRIADSLKAEFEKREIKVNEQKPGILIGLTYCIIMCCGLIPVIGILFMLAGFVCWLIYWIKINSFKVLLKQNNKYI